MSKSFHSVICMYEEKQNQDFRILRKTVIMLNELNHLKEDNVPLCALRQSD
jgi:hypothetical protein